MTLRLRSHPSCTTVQIHIAFVSIALSRSPQWFSVYSLVGFAYLSEGNVHRRESQASVAISLLRRPGPLQRRFAKTSTCSLLRLESLCAVKRSSEVSLEVESHGVMVALDWRRRMVVAAGEVYLTAIRGMESEVNEGMGRDTSGLSLETQESVDPACATEAGRIRAARTRIAQ